MESIPDGSYCLGPMELRQLGLQMFHLGIQTGVALSDNYPLDCQMEQLLLTSLRTIMLETINPLLEGLGV